LEEEWKGRKAELDQGTDEFEDAIVELNGDVDKINTNLEPAIKTAKEKFEKVQKKQTEREDELEGLSGEIKLLKKELVKVTDEVDKIEALIDTQLEQASFVINAIRDLGNACFKKASERIYKGLLTELAKQLNQIFLPLACFFNENDKVLAITSVHESTGFLMLKEK